MLTIQAKGKSINLDTGVFNLACSRTLKRMGQRIKTFSSSAIRERYKINKNKIDPQMSLIPPSVKKLQTSLKVASTRLRVQDFGARYPTSVRARRRSPGVSVEIIRGQRKIIRVYNAGKTYGTFQTKIKGPEGVFVRIGPGTREVREVTTIGVVDMFRGTVVQSQLDKFVDDNLPGELEHQLDFAIQQQAQSG